MHRLSDPQQLNLYAYGRNNPLKFIDPLGLDIACQGDRCDDYLKALGKDVSFKIGYDKYGKVVTVGDIDKKSLSKSDKAFLGAINDDKHHVTINAIDGSTASNGLFLGSSDGNNTGTHTIAFGQAALLDKAANAGGMTSAGLVGHETLEGYWESKTSGGLDALGGGHNWAASLGFPGFDSGTTVSAQAQGGMVIGFTMDQHIQGTNTNERFGMRFVTPIPQADFLNGKGLPAPAYPVTVEKK
jgi:hypothetical protein